mgnify:CR=1 FL=1
MIEVAIGFSAIVALCICFVYFSSKISESLGREKARREIAEVSSERIARGVEKLLGPRPNRSRLLSNWRRRLQNHESKSSNNPTVSDTKSRND